MNWQPPSTPIVAADWPLSLEQAARAEAEARWLGDASRPGSLDLYLGVLLAQPQHAQAMAGRERSLQAMENGFENLLRTGQLAEAARFDVALARLSHGAQATRAGRLAMALQAQAWVDRGRQRLDAGQLFEPAGDSARSAFEQALAALPDYAPAQNGLRAIRDVRLQAAWDQARAGDYPGAEAALRDVRRLGGDLSPLQDVAARIVELRQRRSGRLLAQAHAALDALDVGTAERDLAEARKISLGAEGLDALAVRIERVRRYGLHDAGEVFRDRLLTGGQGPELVVIPYGRFEMGAAAGDGAAPMHERPRHPVEFAQGFALARSEITVAEFRRFLRNSGYRTLAARQGRSHVYDDGSGTLVERRGIDWSRDYAGNPADDELPVVHVAFEDALAYADWLSQQSGFVYRLPSEAEFEYALSAGAPGDSNLSGDGDTSPSGRHWPNAIRGHADRYWGPAPVRSFPVEAFGTYDLAGNVGEWVQDCWHDSYRRAPADGSAWVNPGCAKRVVRGGDWAATLVQARVTARQAVAANGTSGRLGFRVVREIGPR